MNGDFFDADYYEKGLQTGKSLYQNYQWMPHLTIPMTMALVDHLNILPGDKVLDYGCAKGYMVKALRWLRREAYGVDVSQYAIDSVDPEVKPFCKQLILGWPEDLPKEYDFCIAKDVFEHIDKDSLPFALSQIKAKRLFVCVPLGRDGCYFADANNLDRSHIVCEDERWWWEMFTKLGWVVNQFTFKIEGIKEAYYERVPKAHGFFTLSAE